MAEGTATLTITAVDKTKAAFDSVKRGMSDIESATGKLNAALGTLGVGLSVGALASFVKSGIDAADQLNKLSQKVGVTVESLSALKYAAELSDVSLEQLQTGLSKLARNASDASRGNKEAAEAFAEIGVSVTEAGGKLKTTEALLTEVADVFASMEDSAEKTALAVRLFGKAGAELIPFLNQGSVGLEQMRVEAERLGIVLSSETAKAAEEFNDNLTRLTRSMDALKFSIAEQILPPLIKLTGELVAAKTAGEGFFATLNAITNLETGKFGATTAEQLANVNRQLAETDKWRERFKGAAITETLFGVRGGNLLAMRGVLERRQAEEQRKADLAIMKAAPFQEDVPVGSGNIVTLGGRTGRTGGGRAAAVDNRAEQAIKSLDEQIRKTQELTHFEDTRQRIALGHFGKLTALQERELEQKAAALDLAQEDKKTREEALRLAEESDKRRQQALREEDERLTRISESIKDSLDSQRAWRREVEGMVEAYGRGLITVQELNEASMDPRLRALIKPPETDMDVLNRALKEGDISLEKYLETVKRLNPEVEKTNDIARELGLTFTSAFEEAIAGGKGFSDILKGLEQDLLKLGTRKLVTEPLMENLTAMFKGQSGPSMGGIMDTVMGGLGGVFSGITNFFGGFRAGGGPVSAGRGYLVGEGGPELFIPRSSGAIMPAGAGSQINVSNHFTVSGAVDRRSQQQISTAAGEGVRRALARDT